MQVTAYYVDHSPYSLTKVNKIENGFEFNSINGDYVNSETNTTLTIKYLEGMDYEITFRNDYKTKGLLVSTNKMLVDFYSLEFQNGELFLNGERMRKVKYVRK